MAPSGHKAGFTLIELMVVVTIIGVSLLAFAPSFTHSMADRRAATASMELVRLGRRARAESIGLQRAMLVSVEYGRATANRTALMLLLRGNSNRCDVENWATHAGRCAGGETERDGSECMERIDLNSTHWFHAPYAITVGMWREGEHPIALPPKELVESAGNGARSGTAAICYEPAGVVRWTIRGLGPGAGMEFSQLNVREAAGGGLMFATGLVHRGTVEVVNVPRVSLFTLGTTPRRLR